MSNSDFTIKQRLYDIAFDDNKHFSIQFSTLFLVHWNWFARENPVHQFSIAQEFFSHPPNLCMCRMDLLIAIAIWISDFPCSGIKAVLIRISQINSNLMLEQIIVIINEKTTTHRTKCSHPQAACSNACPFQNIYD